MNINTIKTAAMGFAGRAGLVIQKHSPEILIATGIVSTVGSTVLACRATLKVDGILDEAKATQDKIQGVLDGSIEIKHDASYSEEDAKKDLLIVKVQTVGKLVKEYIPAVTLGAFGIGCFLGAHHIMSKRNVALLGLVKAGQEAFDKYRANVVAELGEQKDLDFLYGYKDEETKEKVKDPKTGKTKTVKNETKVATGQFASQYARYFDELNPNWQKSPEQNKYFLQSVQNHMNDRLRVKGHVFLNEVYDELGFERSEAGQLVGWIWNGDGDNYIDFNIFDGTDLTKREFVNGHERSILLDFNVDGVVYDLI